MAEIRLPFSIVYETHGTTPVSDIIEALKATDDLTRDAASLLPSVIAGLQISESSLDVRQVSQESPLRELFFVTLIVTFQDDLNAEVPAVLENLFGVSVSDKYDTILTVMFMTIVFYGAGMAIDAAKKSVTSGLPRQKNEELAAVLAEQTGVSGADIERIIKAHFEKPKATRRFLKQAKRVFLPSQRDGNTPMVIDRDRIDSEMIREIPYPGANEDDRDFDRYTPYSAAELEIHAMDRDKSSTGWAAVAVGISEKRLKMRVTEPVQPSDLWGRDRVIADIVVVSRLTADGFQPSEIQITRIMSG